MNESNSKLIINNTLNNKNKTQSEINSIRLLKAFTMENVINSFNSFPNLEINNYIQSDSDISSITSDCDRCFHFITNNEKTEYQKILKKVLLNIRIPYYQGMADISAYIIYYILTNNKQSSSNVTISNLNPSEGEIKDMSILLEKILYKKVLPLVENDFKKYKEINSIFIKMLENRNIIISNEKSMTYLSNILTFFTRDCENLVDTYFILSVILSCPFNIPFLILIKYFNEIENKKLLKVSLDSNFLKDLILLEDEYLHILTNDNSSKIENSATRFLFGGSIVIIVVAIGFYFFNKNK